MRRVRQKTTAHCGPAVLEMLCSFVGVEIDQDRFVAAVGIGPKLKDYGMTVAEMGQAVAKLAPQLVFRAKFGATIADLSEITKNYNFPVGVEWQGVFFEDADEDNGHYGVVTNVDPVNRIITLADPYKRFAGVDRQFHFEEFEARWWDENEIPDPRPGRVNLVREERLLFVVTTKDAPWPASLGMVKGN